MVRRYAGVWAVVAALVWAVGPAGAADRPNVLWLVAEDFGPHLGCYGAKGVPTPALDRLAADGVRTRASSPPPPCAPPAGRRG